MRFLKLHFKAKRKGLESFVFNLQANLYLYDGVKSFKPRKRLFLSL